MDFNNHKRKPPIYPINQAPPPNWNEFLPPPPQHPPTDSMRKTSQVLQPFLTRSRSIDFDRLVEFCFISFFLVYSPTVAVPRRVAACTPEVSRNHRISNPASPWLVAATATHPHGFTPVRATNTDSIRRLPLNLLR